MSSLRPYLKALVSGGGTIIAGVIFAATDGFTAAEIISLVVLVLTTAGVFQVTNDPHPLRKVTGYRPEPGT